MPEISGSQSGSQDHSSGATTGHSQLLSEQLDGTSGHICHRPATLREYLLSSRSRVRVAVEAQIVLVDLRNRNYHRSSDVLLAGNHSLSLMYRLADAQAGTRPPGRIVVRICVAEVVRHRREPTGEPTSPIRRAGLNGPRSGTGEQGSYTGLAAVTACLQLLLLDGGADRT